MVDDLQLQPGLAAVVARARAAAQLVLSAGHDEQARVRAAEDTVEVRGLDVGFEHDLFLSGHSAVGRRSQRVYPLPARAHGGVLLPLRVDGGAGGAVLLQPRITGADLLLQLLHARGQCVPPGTQGGDVRRGSGLQLGAQGVAFPGQPGKRGLRRAAALPRRVQCLLQRIALRARLVERALRRRAVRVRQLLCAAQDVCVQLCAPRLKRGDLLRAVLHVRLLLPEGRLLRRQAAFQRLQRRERLLLRRILCFDCLGILRGRCAQGGEGICQRVRVERRRQRLARLR